MRLFLLCWMLLLLAGCLPTGPGPATGSAGPPADSLRAAIETAPAPGLARIVFYRQAIPFLQALRPDLIVNGKRVGTAELGGAFIRQARPGGYEVFSTHAPEALVGFTLGAGETRYVKVGPEFLGLGFRLAAKEVPARQALAELGDLELRREQAGR